MTPGGLASSDAAPRRSPPSVLHRRREFVHVQEHGRRFAKGLMALLVAHHDDGPARVGYTVSRKVGNAVIRNRVRRRLREVVRLHPQLLIPGFDHVVIAYNSAAGASYTALREELTWLLDKAATWVQSRGSSSSSSRGTG